MDPQKAASEEKMLTTLTPHTPCPLAAPTLEGYSYTAPQMQMHVPLMYPYIQNQLHHQMKLKPIRRGRVVFSRSQYDILEAAYSASRYPSIETRDRIADQIGVEKERVHCWFRNRRSRQRQAEKDQAKREAIKAELSELREYPVTPINTVPARQVQSTHGYSIRDMNMYLSQGVNLNHPYNNTAASNTYIENFYQNWLTPRNHMPNIVQRSIPVADLVKPVASTNEKVKQEVFSQEMDPAIEQAIAVASITQQDEPEPSSSRISSSSYF